MDFSKEPPQWDRELAERLAAELDVGPLKQLHWSAIDYLREHYLVNATLPWGGNMYRELDRVNDCVHRLFGGSFEAWKIAGLPHPGEEARSYMENLELPEASRP